MNITDIPLSHDYPIYECSPMDLFFDFNSNKSLQNFWHRVYEKYMHYTDAVKLYLETEYKNYFQNIAVDKVIGILLRGTDISAIRPRGHWIQPSPETLINHAQWLMDKEGYEYIFLATEDLNVYQKFKKVFGKKLLVTKTKFLDYTNYSNYIIDAQRMNGVDMYQNNLDYLSALYQLSKLKCFLAGNCTGTMGVLILTEGFDYQYIYNTGRYGIDDKDTLDKKILQLF